ncbi:MAG TPA: hypothetical protein VF546_08780 [Pyrinomonadaceae bacterium]|jgi:hypothetical protein
MRDQPLFSLSLFIVVGVAIALATFNGSVRKNPNRLRQVAQQENNANSMPVVDYEATEHIIPGDTKRQSKNKHYDDASFVLKGPTEGGTATRFDDWELGLAPLPAQQSDVVVLGTITDARAYLSADKTGVYSEFALKVETVLKDDGSQAGSEDTVVVTRPGGRVRYRSGKTMEYTISGQRMPDVGKRYVLFLRQEEHDYSLVTGYELRAGRVYPLDAVKKFDNYRGADETEFLSQLRRSIAETAKAKR